MSVTPLNNNEYIITCVYVYNAVLIKNKVDHTG